MNRGLFGLRGLISDYRSFRRQGDTRRMAAWAAFDYWRWDHEHWMGWNGKPRK
ncbi:hypothetical protein [Mesorhizobium captivum]|uniref:hypothetical protein n=1 Tax=Mesorhizobium captivum TaxID=3072319 RepID=UPI002A23B6CF|nr:hypothetical protein [Mesorhizobium sp. VK23E]MDX8513535.1 hypothetical protein [Mesorhizobium sp. VK23E]